MSADRFDEIQKRYPENWLPASVKVHEIREDVRWLLETCEGLARTIGEVEKVVQDIAPQELLLEQEKTKNPAMALLNVLKGIAAAARKRREPGLVIVPRLDTKQIQKSIMEGANAHKG
jgi:hypothetical protein